jgi:hypothetical protein
MQRVGKRKWELSAKVFFLRLCVCVCECGGIINWIAGARREQKRASIHTVDGTVAVNEATQQKKKKDK